jgi:hypothetical protein
LSGRWVRHQSGRAGIRGSSSSVDLPSQHVEQVCTGRNDLNRREHDDGHHHRQHGDPGPPGPTGQPRTRDEHSGRRPGFEWRPRMRDERRTDPPLPSNSHPHRFPSRADPPPRQPAGSPVPIIERLDSIIQTRRREQPPQESLVCRSSVAHAVQFLPWAKRYVERAPKSAYLDQITTDSIRSDGRRLSGPNPTSPEAPCDRPGQLCPVSPALWSCQADQRAATALLRTQDRARDVPDRVRAGSPRPSRSPRRCARADSAVQPAPTPTVLDSVCLLAAG